MIRSIYGQVLKSVAGMRGDHDDRAGQLLDEIIGHAAKQDTWQTGPSMTRHYDMADASHHVLAFWEGVETMGSCVSTSGWSSSLPAASAGTTMMGPWSRWMISSATLPRITRDKPVRP